MTEVVTLSTALSQLSLLASRQQVFSVDRLNSVNGANPADAFSSSQAADPAIQKPKAPEGETAGHHESAEQKQADQSAKNNSGPSRPRIEIRSLDIGLTPSEVVGTPDVLQRFDVNGDGRVDLLESERASQVREKATTFAGLAGAPVHLQNVGPATPAPAPVPASTDVPEIPGAPKKVFTTAEAAEALAPKKLYADTAAQGAAAGGIDVPKKFYGQGAEVIVGQAAIAATPDAPAKISQKVVIKDQIVTEDGSGEAKLYDKVPQTDTEQNQGQASTDDGGKLYEKAQQVAAQTSKKTVVVEVSAYAATAATTDTSTPAATTTVVTA